ncbi:hypothetical protein CB0940_10963 [Cercospora beticola]|uniref:Uncharacterized protein n=1 Tax=Cercospora beticola TaxID=122368 RepID=A0A2G5HDW7_CERBT|nr:hypothetical protein CB0940_10963 [Cercospora beticola]PIA90709.1 hypothetical protein CB0940_10963 [Cercospora beticola]WPB07685.1 hypothetical protein RHO25_012346 [Cercospora beticola]
MAPNPQVPSLGGILGGAAAPAPAASIVGAAPSLAAPAAISNVAGAVPVAAALPTNVAVPSANGLPNVAIPTGSILSVTGQTVVPLASTALVQSLAGLPINSGIPGLPSLAGALSGLPLPTTALSPDLPLSSLPTNVQSLIPSGVPLSLPLSAPISVLPSSVLETLPTGLPGNLPLSALPIQNPALPTGLPYVPLEAISPVQAILATLGESLISKLTDQLATIIATITSAVANVPVSGNPTAVLAGLSRHSMNTEESEKSEEKRQLPDVPGSQAVGGAVNTVTNLLGGVTGGLSGGAAGGSSPLAQLGALTGVTSALTGGVLANSNPLSFLTGGALKPLTDGSLIPVGSIVGGLTGNSGGNILSGVQSSLGSAVSNGLGLAGNAANPLAGVQNTVQGAISGLTGGAAGGNPLGGLLSGLSLSGGPLSSVTGVLGNLGLGSIVLNVVSLLPVPQSLQDIVTSLVSTVTTSPANLLTNLPTGQLTQLQSALSLLNLFSSLNIGSLGPLRDLTNVPAIQSAASQINTQDLLTTLSLLKTPSFLPTNLASPGALLSNPTELLSTIQKLSTQVQQPSPAAAFLLLQQINAGGLGDLVSALPSAAPAVPAAPSAPALPNLGALTGGLSGAAPASASANVGANGNAGTTIGRGRMMDNEMMDEEEVAEE